ncbi:hypothetical protein ACFLT2_11805 [Acidobacteriota bacterium]
MIQKRNKAKGLIVLFAVVLISQSVFSMSSGKKLIVVANNAPVYLEPDQKSTVIATLEKGSILTLSSERKFRQIFNYVYFTSQKTGCTKSGYIHDSYVDKLFNVTKVITIQGQSQSTRNSLKSDLYLDKSLWSMSSSQLRNIKGDPIHEGQSQGYNIIGYRQTIMDRECLVGFYFEGGRLVGAKFSFAEQSDNKNQNIVDYKKIKELLIQKFGRPEQDNISWKDASHKDDIEEWGNAIGMGHLEYSSKWRTRQADVMLQLDGSDEEISLELTYKGTT